MARWTPAHLATITSGGRWQPYRHLRLVNKKLIDVAAGRIKRLMVFMPPRHGKSELISQYFPVWFLGQNPDAKILLTSYGADFARSWGGKARKVMDEFGEHLFGVEIDPRIGADKRWAIKGHMGELTTAGVRGPIVGRGANVLIIDDPVKSNEEARSLRLREHTYEWYRATASPRLEGDPAAVILVMQRWHWDDLAGRLLEDQETGGEQWEVLALPAIVETTEEVERDPLDRESGEVLCPDMFDRDHLMSTRGRIGEHWWSALYQQKPEDDQGDALWTYDIIDKNRVAEAPAQLPYIVVGVDPSGTQDDRSSSVGIIVVGVAYDGRGYVLDDRTMKGSPGEWGRAVLDAYFDWQADFVVGETNYGGDMVEHTIRSADPERGRQVAYKEVRASRGKRLRAEPVAALYESGIVHHVGTFPELERQMTRWTPQDADSPDRLDGLVWGLTESLLKHQGERIVIHEERRKISDF